MDQNNNAPVARKPRGFAALSPERRAEISSKGGKMAHATARGHRFTSEEARAAGRLGGRKTQEKRLAAKNIIS
jgi:general stress protein YciG